FQRSSVPAFSVPRVTTRPSHAIIDPAPNSESHAMPVTRRSFLTTLGAGSAGLLTAPLLNWRGHEALSAFHGQAARKADRLLATKPGMVRLDSNENPNGPGQRVYDTIIKHLTDSNRYPVKGEDDLIAVIAKLHKVTPENIILGCGSGELLRTAVY